MKQASAPGVKSETLEVRGVLFDMDGVLVSSTGSVLRCWRQWAAHYEVAGADQFEIPHGMRAVEIIEQYTPGVDTSAALRHIEDIEIADVADLAVLPGVHALLASLPPDRWTIVTSATRRLMVARLGIADIPVPAGLITAEMVTRGKPDPEPYRMGAERIGVPAEACLVVEDAPNGVRAGVQAGCRVLGVEGTYRKEELLDAGAEVVVSSLEHVSAQVAGDALRLTFLQP